MKLLLDTHSLIWWVDDNPKLGPQTRSAIADPGNEVLVSVASFWEIAIKRRISKLDASGAELMREVEGNRFGIVPMESRQLRKLEEFVSRPGHNDPFDHLILIQAVESEAVLVTGDREMRGYGLHCL